MKKTSIEKCYNALLNANLGDGVTVEIQDITDNYPIDIMKPLYPDNYTEYKYKRIVVKHDYIGYYAPDSVYTTISKIAYIANKYGLACTSHSAHVSTEVIEYETRYKQIEYNMKLEKALTKNA